MRPHRRLWAGSPACSPASKGPYRHLVAGGYDTRWAYHGMPFPRSWAGGSSSEASHHLCLNGLLTGLIWRQRHPDETGVDEVIERVALELRGSSTGAP